MLLCCLVFQLSKSNKKSPLFRAGFFWNPIVLWILPTPAAPWICRHDGVIDDLTMGAHKYAARPTLPFAHRFGFGESQHFQLWLNSRAAIKNPPFAGRVLESWLLVLDSTLRLRALDSSP